MFGLLLSDNDLENAIGPSEEELVIHMPYLEDKKAISFHMFEFILSLN